MRITEGGLDDARVVALLEHHVAMARSVSPRESAHALDVDELRGPDMCFWSMWDGDALVAIGALRSLSPEHGEVKSMHTVEQARGKGAARAMMEHIIAKARALGMRRLSLETGVQPYFAPAVRFYEKSGFKPCPPYGHYKLDPNSMFMTLAL